VQGLSLHLANGGKPRGLKVLRHAVGKTLGLVSGLRLVGLVSGLHLVNGLHLASGHHLGTGLLLATGLLPGVIPILHHAAQCLPLEMILVVDASHHLDESRVDEDATCVMIHEQGATIAVDAFEANASKVCV